METLYRCPQCGNVDDLQGFDVLGADDGNLFCIKCHLENPMEEVHEGSPDSPTVIDAND